MKEATLSATQEREQQLVRGTVTSVLVKGNDSWQIAVRPDNSQYEKKIWTKDAALVNSIQQQGIGQRFDFLCNASYWTNNQNQQVRSLWYEAIGEYGTMQEPAPVPQPTGGLPGMGGGVPLPGVSAPLAPQQPVSGPSLPGVGSGAPQPQAAAQGRDPNWDSIPPVVREQRILRQTAMKCAVHMLPYLGKDMQTVSGLEFVSERFVAYFMAGPQDAQLHRQYTQTAVAERNEYVESHVAPPDDETPPDWVTSDGPVPPDYNANAPAPEITGSEDTRAYEGGFPA